MIGPDYKLVLGAQIENAYKYENICMQNSIMKTKGFRRIFYKLKSPMR